MSLLFRSLQNVGKLVINELPCRSNGLKLIVNRLAVPGSQMHTSVSRCTPMASRLSCSTSVCSGGPITGNQTSSNAVCSFGSREQITWANTCVQSVRNRMRKHYQPSAWKRINKHGIEQRFMTESGIHVLWRRFLKKRFNLAPFERVLPGTIDGKILPKHQIPKVSKKEIERILKRK